MLILNTGGTFNKRYNPLIGEQEVPFDNLAPEQILSNFTYDVEMAGLIYKDSLDMDMDDRKMMVKIMAASKETHFIIIHGTDTMDVTASFLAEILEGKIIILTGAMVPFEIDPIEATSNLSMALGYAKLQKEAGVYICMQGSIAKYDKLKKNKKLGKFERVQD
ncbi:asparaginase [Sulfurimonas sp. MAG313]|nr:asparaginase domain-containing protein [Sulfurimonas sp. MAG313]MDF1880045.1 asparaginase [Sulfurimonas sp. MAG313]